jgi:hypothetical protein
MKTITIKIESDKDASLLKRLLEEAEFEAFVESYEEDDDISEEEMRMLESRWEKYQTNPQSAIPYDELKEKIKKKYGL